MVFVNFSGVLVTYNFRYGKLSCCSLLVARKASLDFYHLKLQETSRWLFVLRDLSVRSLPFALFLVVVVFYVSFEAFVTGTVTRFETVADIFLFFDSGGETAYRQALHVTLSIVCPILPRRQSFESSTRRFQKDKSSMGVLSPTKAERKRLPRMRVECFRPQGFSKMVDKVSSRSSFKEKSKDTSDSVDEPVSSTSWECFINFVLRQLRRQLLQLSESVLLERMPCCWSRRMKQPTSALNRCRRRSCSSSRL